MELRGRSLIGYSLATSTGSEFQAVNPAAGKKLPGSFFSATAADVDRAARLASAAFEQLGLSSGKQRSTILQAIAAALEGSGDEIVTRANLETALPLERLRGELARTADQLRLFASLLDEGSWVNARIDTALPDRKPLPRPDIRSMLRPLGPVAVFGASNFPLAFSVAGGDTASALAAGNPVIVKAHPAHPGTSEMVGRLIVDTLQQSGAPEGTFSLLFDSGIEVGRQLVEHPFIKAGGFTGSRTAGRALMDIAARRAEPIPFFAEMSSTNPVFVLPGALRERAQQIATGLHTSFTLGVGQFCTKPGLVAVARDNQGDQFVSKVAELTATTVPATMLTGAICNTYRSGSQRRSQMARVLASATPSTDAGYRGTAFLYETDMDSFSREPELADELFGPATLMLRYDAREQLLAFASSLEGHLTATVHGTEQDLLEFADLIAILEHKVGRIIFNGFPTGVEVSHAMVHGGPYPATSDARFTSVGMQAILRFARPVCYQNFTDSALPAELKKSNPLGLMRLVNGTFTREHA